MAAKPLPASPPRNLDRKRRLSRRTDTEGERTWAAIGSNRAKEKEGAATEDFMKKANDRKKTSFKGRGKGLAEKKKPRTSDSNWGAGHVSMLISYMEADNSEEQIKKKRGNSKRSDRVRAKIACGVRMGFLQGPGDQSRGARREEGPCREGSLLGS